MKFLYVKQRARRLLGLAGLLAATAPAAMAQHGRHYINLQTQVLPAPFRPGRIVRVLDARPDRTHVGWVQTGLDNNRVAADFKEGLAAAFEKVLSTAPPALDTVRYALRVHQFTVGEITTANSEAASADLVADLLRLRPDGQYDLLARSAVAVERKGIEVTGMHAGNAAQVLQQCLARFEQSAPAQLPALAVLSPEQAAQPEASLVSLLPLPFLAEAKHRPGVYQTLAELQQNAPGINRVVALSKTPRKKEWAGTDDVELYYVAENGVRTPVRNVWGYCDGRDVYILYRRDYYLLTPTPEGFEFLAPSAPKGSEVMAGAMLGGVVGAGIAAAASGGYPQRHSVNLFTGRITALPLESKFADASPTSVEGRIVVYRRRPEAAPVAVSANGLAVGQLSPETVSVALPWADKRRAAKLCVGSGAAASEACTEALPLAGETLYYELEATGTGANFKPVSAKEALFEIRRAELRARAAK